MSLTKTDIREVFNEGFETLISPRFDGLESRMDGIESRLDRQEQATKGLREEMRAGFVAVSQRIDELEERFSTQLSELEVDIRHLYKLVEKLQKANGADKEFKKRTVEQKILTLYEQFRTVAKEAGVTLPR